VSQFVFACVAAAAFAASLFYFLFAYLFLFGPPPSFSVLVAASAAAAPTPSASAYAASLVNLALFTVFALHHSLFARTSLKAAVTAVVPPQLERAVYTLIASALFALVCWAWRPVEGVAWSLPGPWRWVGFTAQLAGIVLTLVGARELDALELAGVRQVLPDSTRTQALKIDGLYGFVRHPLYFAWMLFVFGSPDMTMTRLSFALISTMYLMIAVPFEERSLIETFGADYASYRRKVRWRMIPGFY
jgi:protein-S-isoprenylcysteine O-methyltransferase Ste14